MLDITFIIQHNTFSSLFELGRQVKIHREINVYRYKVDAHIFLFTLYVSWLDCTYYSKQKQFSLKGREQTVPKGFTIHHFRVQKKWNKDTTQFSGSYFTVMKVVDVHSSYRFVDKYTRFKGFLLLLTYFYTSSQHNKIKNQFGFQVLKETQRVHKMTSKNQEP